MSIDVVARTTRVCTAARVLGAFALVASAGCTDLLNPGSGAPTVLTFRGPSTSASVLSSSASASLASIPVTGGGHTVDVRSVDVLIDQVKLERVRSGDERDSDANEDDSETRNDETFRSGPTTVSLPLSGGSVSPFTQALPVGEYDELQLKARSLRLQGTYDGQAFDVTVPVEVKIETRLSPPLRITSSTDRPDVTVMIDALAWFRNRDGSVIDPRALASNAQLRAEFRARVRASVRAFKDKDRDGVDSDSR